MEPIKISFESYGGALCVDGQDGITQSDVRSALREWYLANGWDAWDADDYAGRARFERAWWGGAELGFVQADHEQGRGVIVVQGVPVTR